MANDSSRASDSAAAIGRSEVDAARNRSFGAGLVDDPYPIYHQLLEQCPVHSGGIAEHFGIPVIDAFADSAQSFTAFGYRSVVDALRDDRTFSNQWYDRSLNLMIGPNMLGMMRPPTSVNACCSRARSPSARCAGGAPTSCNPS